MSDEKDLLAGISSRDPEAFRTLMESEAPRVIQHAFGLLKTMTDAENAAHHVFVRLYRKPPRLTPEIKLSTWLLRLTTRFCRDFLRKKHIRRPFLSHRSEYPRAHVSSEFKLELWRRLMEKPAPSHWKMILPLAGGAVVLGIVTGTIVWHEQVRRTNRWDLFGNAPFDTLAGSYVVVRKGEAVK